MNCEARVPREALDHLIQAGDQMAELICQLLKNNTLSNGPMARDFAEAQRKWDASARRVAIHAATNGTTQCLKKFKP